MFRILFVFILMFAPTIVMAAVCPAGEYLLNGECAECIKTAFCPGDDTAHSCSALFTPQSGIELVMHYTNAGTRATSPDDCYCRFDVSTPNNPSAQSARWGGKCAVGPTEYIGVPDYRCRPGYYAAGTASDGVCYPECAPCTNGLDNSVYLTRGSVNGNDCQWKCADGYKINTDGTACDKLCTLGFTTLNTSTGITVPLYEEKRTTPSINIGDVNGACHADLAPGRATGAINVMYNGEIYHTISPTTTLQCDAGYYLSDSNACNACMDAYYCPGDNTRIHCDTTIVDEPGIPRPRIYHESVITRYRRPESCRCRWELSDETKANYFVINACYLGMRNENTYVYYYNCRIGHYAIRWKGSYYWDCAPCYNGPEHSHYTSYSTPSVTGAEESNCPWECDDGYVRDGDTCVLS